MSKNVVEISDESFEKEVLKSALPVLVDFWAPWCAPCKAMAPMVEAIARDYSGRIKVCGINIDDNIQVATQQQIMNIPTLVLFNKEKQLMRVTGLTSAAEIRKKIEEVLGV